MVETVLLWIAIVATVIFVIKFVLSLFSMGTDVDADFGGDFGFDLDGDVDGGIDAAGDDVDSGTSDTGLVLFTLDGILVFLMIFSWVALTLLSFDVLPEIACYVIAVLAGFLMMVIYAFIIKKIRQLETAQVKDVYPEVGDTGIVYLTVKQEQKGQVKFSLKGKQVILDVFTTDEIIPTGEYVQVVAVDGKRITVTADKK